MSKVYKTTIDKFIIREATEKDVSLILHFIRELADYEKLLHEVKATEEILRDSIFVRKACQVVIAEYDDVPVGFALFFHNFSTFTGKPGIYLEDLYVSPEYRGKGFGKALLSFLAYLAEEKDCARFEWWCIDWNKPSIDFYLEQGAIAMDEWTVYRVCDEALPNLAKKFPKA